MCEKYFEQFIRFITFQAVKTGHEARVEIEHFVAGDWVCRHERVQGLDGALAGSGVPVVEDRVVDVLFVWD
jgi:hypothetical protein